MLSQAAHDVPDAALIAEARIADALRRKDRSGGDGVTFHAGFVLAGAVGPCRCGPEFHDPG